MRLIDADALEKDLAKRWDTTDCADFADKEVWRALREAQAIDAVPVVRCKDCRCWTEWSNGTGSCSRFALDWIGTDADDFCSMGERKDDDKSCDTCKHYDKGWDDVICDGCTTADSHWERRNDEQERY